jgi:hypothetical protein
MSEKNTAIPCFEEVELLLKGLRHSVEKLTRKHSSTTPPYTPDYFSFHNDMHTLLLPVYEYFDHQFHKGNVTDSTL